MNPKQLQTQDTWTCT